MSEKISIIIPAYNEEKTIAQLLKKTIAESSHWDTQIIVVNDGSKDATVQALQPLLDRVVLVSLGENAGKGKAIREGLKKATGEVIILQDADLELDPADYQKLLAPLLAGKAQVVYGSRILGKTQHTSTLFFLGGKLMTWLANWLYGLRLTDETNGYKIMGRQLMESLQLESDGFEICSEMTAKIAKRGIVIHEVAVSYHPRSSQEGKKLKVSHGIQSAWALVKYKFKK